MKLQLAWLHGSVAAIHKAWLQWQPGIFLLRCLEATRTDSPFLDQRKTHKTARRGWLLGWEVKGSWLVE